MEPIQPSKPAGIGGLGGLPAGMPLTEEWFKLQKKNLEQAGMIDSPNVLKAEDVANLTPQAAQELDRTKYDTFLDDVKQEIMELDPEAEDFLPQATGRLVSSALKQEYGDKLTKDPGYPQMEAVIVKKILGNPEHTEAVQGFLGLLITSEELGRENRDS